MNLRERFGTFIKTMRSFESVDGLLRHDPCPGKQRADYVLWERAIVMEQKALVVDPADKPPEYARRLLEQGTHSPISKDNHAEDFRQLAGWEGARAQDVPRHDANPGEGHLGCRQANP